MKNEGKLSKWVSESTLNHSEKAAAIGILELDNKFGGMEKGGIGVDVFDCLVNGKFCNSANCWVQCENSSNMYNTWSCSSSWSCSTCTCRRRRRRRSIVAATSTSITSTTSTSTKWQHQHPNTHTQHQLQMKMKMKTPNQIHLSLSLSAQNC